MRFEDKRGLRSVPAVVAALLLATSRAAPEPEPEPARPVIQAGWNTTNLFWPGETDLHTNLTYACTYTGYVVMAEDTLVAFGACNLDPKSCNGYHALPPEYIHTPKKQDHQPKSTCMKFSPDSGRSWSQIRMVHTVAGEAFAAGGLVYDRITKQIISQFTSNGTVWQTSSADKGESWSKLRNISVFLGDGFPLAQPNPTVGPGNGLQLSPSNKFAPGRLLFAGHHGRYTYDAVWYSDDHGASWKMSLNQTTGRPAKFLGLDEPAIAETPSGGVALRARNFEFHGPGKCNCRGTAESDNGGSSFQGQVGFDPGLPEPVCQGTMINYGPGLIVSSMPGFGTDTEKKDGHDGRGNGIVRWSVDGGKSWVGNVHLWDNHAYSYSGLTLVPTPGYLGLAWETVLPESGPHKRDISTNNVLFTLIPTNIFGTVQPRSIELEAVS